jgi:hypothetical protein
MWKSEAKEDRRSKHRFTMQREMRFKVLENERIVVTGTGRTIDMSSNGIAFESGSLKPGSLVELSVSWPVLLDETCMMRLIVFGRVVRASNHMAACTIDKYEFRTQARAAQFQSAPVLNNSLRRWIGTVERDVKISART